MASAVALVQGASKGLGLQFCRHILASRPDVKVIATSRFPDKSEGLMELHGAYHGRLDIIPLDVTKEDQVATLAGQLKEQHKGMDLLINCAAMLHPSGRGETSLSHVSAEGLSTTFATNTVGPLLMAKYFQPLLAKGTGSFGLQGEKAKDQHASVLVNMSAKVGSITDNGLGGWYSYRMTKAALNMATKNLSIELGRGRNKVLCVSLHPGTVDTDLSRPYHKGVPAGKLFSTELSVQYLMGVIDNLNIKETGSYIMWDGTKLPF